MTHKRTVTDVIVTQYPATFGAPPATATIQFGRVKSWRLSHWQYRETLTRRRRWTVAREWLAWEDTEDYTDALRRDYPGMFKDSIDMDGEPRAILVRQPGGDAVVVFLEQRAHR